jgi:hypothetical protein
MVTDRRDYPATFRRAKPVFDFIWMHDWDIHDAMVACGFHHGGLAKEMMGQVGGVADLTAFP